jgi:pimeloyl-ACP methyl ester carboxylesterase
MFLETSFRKKERVPMKTVLLLLPLMIVSIRGGTSGKEAMNDKNDESVKSGYAPVGAGLKMYYETRGSGGTPLVLIHGGGSTIQTTFGNVLRYFSRDRQVIAVELQGHGHTADVDRPFSFEQDADDVAELLKRLNVNRADFLGFSNGGSTAPQIGIRHPEIVNKLVIASAFYQRGGLVPGFFDLIREASLMNMPEPLKAAYLEVAPDKQHLGAMHNKDRDRMLQFKDWSDESLRSIKAPTLLLIGDQDIVTPEHAVKMSHVLSQARLMILTGTHGAYMGEVCTAKPGSKMAEWTAGMIMEFLGE